MKKNKIISILLLFITAFFFSCKNEIKIHTPENNGQSFTITGKIENPHNQLGARYVQPDVSSFVYKITAKNGADTVTSTSTTATYTISLTKGTWTLIVEGFLGNDEDVVNSSTAVLISDEIPFQVIDETSTPEVASLKIKSDTNGEIDLSIIVTDPSIKSCSLIINGGTAINGTVSNSKVHFSKSSLSTGTYSALFTFYDDSGNEICSYSDVITILAGQKTAKFVNNGNPFIDVSGNFNVTEDIVSRLNDKTVYVRFTNQPSNGKIPSGKIIDPFPNLQTAVDYINRSNKGEDSYYIKILNNIIADYSTDSVFCNIESVKDLDLTIESYGSEIYTINASKQPSNPGRAFNISGKNDSQLNLTLKNIKVTGGFMEAETGSQAAEGVYIGENATLKLDGNVDIQSVGGAQDGCVIVNDTILSDSKFVYIPVSYTVGTQLVSGAGLSQIAGNITIPDTVSDGVTQNWSISADGRLIAAKVYISQMIELPSAGDTVYVRSPEDLLALAGFVNEGKYKVSDSLTIDYGTPFSFEGIVIEQEKTVSLSGKAWIPIGNASNTFKGTYKGGNKSITDLSIENSGVDKVGLFGYTENAEIYDLTVSSTMDITTDTPSYVGIICAYAVNTTFNDCTVTGKIEITKAFSGAKIGGICGESSDGTFINCTSNLDKISLAYGNSYALGGIAGCVQSDVIDNCTNKSSLEILNASEDTSDYIGGIAGYCGEVTLINNFTELSIKVPTSMCYSGGIAGVYWSYDTEYGYIQNCYANITFSGGFFGGILGAVVLDEDFVKIQNCVADITLNNYIEGAIYGITDCECGDYEITVFIENCFWNNSALPIYPIEIPGTTTSNNSPFASSSDQWYGELDYPVTCDSDKKTKALVYALNSWVNQQNSSGSTQYKNWCVSDGKLTFGTQPSVSEPPYYVSAQNYNVSQLTEIPISGTTLYVNNAEDLMALATLVNQGTIAGNTYELNETDRRLNGVTIIQTQPISLSGKTWVPIGNNDKGFSGTYDGGGLAITNLTCTATTNYDYPAFIGKGYNAIIKNVDLSGQVSSTQYTNAGGIVNEMENGTIKDCINRINVSASSSYTNGACGGIAAITSGTVTINGCINEGNVSVEKSVSASGGIVGNSGNGNLTIVNCINKGIIQSNANSSGNIRLGGILGYGSGYSSPSGKVYIYNCYNAGKITSLSNSSANVQGAGFIGNVNPASIKVYIENSVTSGKVENVTTNRALVGLASGSNSYGYFTNVYWLENSASKAYSDVAYTVTATNVVAYTEYSTGGILSGPGITIGTETGVTSLIDALNIGVELNNENIVNPVYKNWVYDSTGLHFGTPSSGKTYVSELSADDLVEGATYYVGTAEDLKSLANLVNSGEAFEGITIVQDKLINLNNDEWIPIGNNAETFSGTYLGNGYEIKGLRISSSNNTISPGLFGNLYYATIDGVNVSGTITSNAEYIGGITSSISCSTLKNCISSVNIQCSDTSSTMNYIGGLVGLAVYDGNYGSDIDNCCYVGEITVSNKIRAAGGIAGGVAYGSSLNIRNTVNRGNVTYSGSVPSTTEVSLAGFVGELCNGDSTDYSEVSIINCGNKGKVTGVTAGSGAYCYASGFVCTLGDFSVCNIENCFNISEISGADANAAFYTKKRAFTNITYDYLYWDNVQVNNWKNEGSTDDSHEISGGKNVIKTLYTDGYTSNSMSWTLVAFLNNWIDSKDSSLYKIWSAFFDGFGEVLQGAGTPYLDYESSYL